MKGVVIDGDALVLADDDNVATALDDLDADREFETGKTTVELVETVPFGHKFALGRISAGQPVRKYGEVIGTATQPIDPGEWVHTHNCESTRGRGDLPGGEDA